MTTADPVTESERLEPRVATTWRVRVLRGPEPVSGPPAKLDLAQRELIIGSSEECSFRLTDPRVSRRHLSMRLTPLGVAVRDLGSTNGTFCRGLRVTELMLTQMTIVRVGRTDLQVLPAQVSGVLLAPKRFGGLVASSEAMRAAIACLERSHAVRSPLLLQGESGCGKERAARAIASAAGDLPFVRLDLATWDASAGLDSPVPHYGSLGAAQGGTLYLDQLTSAGPEAQAALVQLFERSHPRPAQGPRVIAASQLELGALVGAGKFRKDLYYHLAGTCITLPPLRDRPEDISVIAFDLLGELGAGELDLPAAVVDALVAHEWPGNVRELRAALERLVQRARAGAGIAPEDLEFGVLARAFPPPAKSEPLPPLKNAKQALVHAWERQYLSELLKRYRTLSAAARAAGITRVHLYRLMKRHGLDNAGDAEQQS